MNILVIGLGHHARRIYLPYLNDSRKSLQVNNIFGIDINTQEDIIDDYIDFNNYNIKVSYINENDKDDFSFIFNYISNFIKDNSIDLVIIATDPLYHFMYSKIVLENDIGILLDKPITLATDMVNNPTKSHNVLREYYELCDIYKSRLKINKYLQFDIMAQRRFHKGYQIVKDRINEVFKFTNCNITSINSFHSDGQWRLPDEIIDLDYHGYNQGYGKVGHSGYHTIDIVCWFMNNNYSNKNSDNADVISFSTNPNDYLNQINYSDYNNLFDDFLNKSKYSQSEYIKKTSSYGEIDSFNTIAFKNGNKTNCLASINLVHNGLSQRGRFDISNRNLYKGNGRVRQEFIMIEQGPFQSILLETFQSKEINTEISDKYSMGGEKHFEVHIFRNSSINGKWKDYEKISINDLYNNTGKGYSRGHNEQSRRDGIKEFIYNYINKNNYINSVSNILDHELSVKIFTGIYKSIANKNTGKNPYINIKL